MQFIRAVLCDLLLGPELKTQVSQISETLSEQDHPNGYLRTQSDESRKKSVSIDKNKCETAVGKKLIEAEKSQIGNVKWNVYKHYIKYIGVFMTITTIGLDVLHQAFSIASNFWLSIWSSDNEAVINGTVDTAKRDMYLGVYGALGVGQCKFPFRIFFCFTFGVL